MSEEQDDELAQEQQPDDSEPSIEREAELRAAYDANVAQGHAPYEDVAIRTHRELLWTLHERGWTTGPHYPSPHERVNLRGADLGGATLTNMNLTYANLDRANLCEAKLDGVSLREASLVDSDLMFADLSRAHLDHANLTNARLSESSLIGAHLEFANLSGADLDYADLSAAHIDGARMDISTALRGAKLDSRTRLVDVLWNGALVTRLNWERVSVLGEDWAAQHSQFESGHAKTNQTRLQEFQAALTATRQVAKLLRDQGLGEDADRFAYRAYIVRRQVFRRHGQWGPLFGSWLLDLVAGYGYKPMRSVITYLLVIAAFAGVYFGLGVVFGQSLSWNEAIVVSLSAFHGRGFFSTTFSPGDPQAAVAAVEAVFGLVIEIVFIATFTQRFFNSR